MNITDLQTLAASVGFPDPNLAAAVAMAESSGNTNAYGDAEYGGSIGLWQINLPSSPQYDATSLTDPIYNARAALAISKRGTNWNPWTTFRTGAYKKWYPGPGGPSIEGSTGTNWKTVAVASGVVLGAGSLAWWLKNRFL
jgi:soluble lytic murein transglycosylase-like protein